jgi:5-methyltetrahydrofolate--homocysteine methyltransferase
LSIILNAVFRRPGSSFEGARKIIQHAADHGIPPENVLIATLVMPVGAVLLAGKNASHLVRCIQEELKVNTVCGASNISFGLPDRAGLNAVFISMLIANGITCAIASPMEPDIQRAILA